MMKQNKISDGAVVSGPLLQANNQLVARYGNGDFLGGSQRE